MPFVTLFTSHPEATESESPNTTLLEGTSFGICLGFNPKNYSPSTYLEQQQNLISSLVVLATMVTLLSVFLQRKNRTVFVTLLAAAAFFISCMLITRFGNVPIQTEMLTWEANAMPANWTTLRDKWWWYHMMRTIVELIALVLVTWAIVQNKTTQIEKRS